MIIYASPVFSRNVYSTTKYKPIFASIPCKQTEKIKIISATVTVDSINHAPLSLYSMDREHLINSVK